MNLFSLFTPKTETFLKVLQEYFTHITPGKKDSTLDKYGFFYNTIRNFMRATNREGIQLHEIKVKTMEEMRAWLHAEKPRTGEHVSRHIEHCQAAFDYAIMMEYIRYNPIVAIKVIREKLPEPVSLDQKELAKLMKTQFSTPNRQLVLDLFLFQCFTGLSYIDLWLYEIETDYITHEGKKIQVQFVTSKAGRGKNSKPYSSQLNIYAKAIHDKYDGKFPTITNQGYNKLLKKITFSLNISKDLSTHNARKTYSTLRYKQGMSMEGLADEMGNTPAMLKKHYITNSRDRIKRDIQQLNMPFLDDQEKTAQIYVLI